jgi:hypothetical protein
VDTLAGISVPVSERTSTPSFGLRSSAAALLRNEGLWGLTKGVLRYFHTFVKRIAHTGSYYIYRYPIPCVDENRFRPAVDLLEVRTVESLDDVARLVADGYEDPRARLRSVERGLAAGACAVCAFVDRRFAYIGWVAISADAKRTFDPLPYHVAFDQGEGATGGAWTAPRFRGLGLYRYVFGRELDLLRRKGCTVCCNSISVGNLASQRGQAFYEARVCARARAIRILGFKKWSESPMSGPCPSLTAAHRPVR